MGKKIVFLLASLFTVWIANGQNTMYKGSCNRFNYRRKITLCFSYI